MKNRVKYRCRICNLTQEAIPSAVILNKYSIIRCRQCSFESVCPLPSLEDLRGYYKDYSYTKLEGINDQTPPYLYQKIIDYLLSAINSNKKKISFLDYGFGKGAFLKQINKNGFLACGIELGEQSYQQMIQHCKENNSNIDVVKITDHYLNYLPHEPFDCITLFYVIEHVLDPSGLLSYLSAHQESGGILYLECPNNDALYLKVKNLLRRQIHRMDFFNTLNPPQHINGFNRRSITELLRQCGYRILEVDDFYVADYTHMVESLTWYLSFRELLLNSKLWHPYPLLQCLHKRLDLPASKILRSGSGLYALARKI